MAQGFARLYRRFWADERVRTLSPDEKLIAVYLLTGQSNRIGLFRFSVGMAEDDTGIPRKRLDTLLDRVCDTLRWGYDRGAGVVFIRSWWRWNAPESPLTMIGYLKDLNDIPNTELINEFRNNRNTLSDTVWHTLQDRVPESPSLSLSLSRAVALAEDGAEPESDAPPAFADCASIPLNDGTEYRPTQPEVDEWRSLYPVVDVLQELREMRGWSTSNPEKRKTRRGVVKFVVRWLAKEQDKGHTNGNGKPQVLPAEKPPEFWTGLDTALGDLVHEPMEILKAQTLARKYLVKYPEATQEQVIAALREKTNVKFEEAAS